MKDLISLEKGIKYILKFCAPCNYATVPIQVVLHCCTIRFPADRIRTLTLQWRPPNRPGQRFGPRPGQCNAVLHFIWPRCNCRNFIMRACVNHAQLGRLAGTLRCGQVLWWDTRTRNVERPSLVVWMTRDCKLIRRVIDLLVLIVDKDTLTDRHPNSGTLS